ncbi:MULTISPECIES: HlyD family type I secretion periplasmic adaptor subunit [unclassified Sphingomonas]|uniref:HlyD family type I secretion periplasmic adaptor subunit n=1 Tax=unclassified Sphingomonas TaxID=196159 RepID=UPI001D11A9EF|nr:MULTISPECIES: HlyD family type I secretion periplasmic adaptor subunit [unclassified Sphingomonas]MCC2979971.1 HlyD family type I secretion periplasmic adaptor subunit [Sphingomonas sp. IC4-52]MCD2314733.1 HlyD family type I secretion periplasmic adaptor subunit [Sphingomonas sp. IC-11]
MSQTPAPRAVNPLAPAEPTRLEDLAERIKPRQASNVLLWAILAFFVIFIIWASWATLDRTVRGPGRVIASSQLQTVSNLEGGIVQEILVRTGQVVRAGQPLVRLDPTATGGELSSGEAQAAALQVKIARLKAEVLGREPVYPAPINAAVAEQIEIEKALHTARMQELAGITGAYGARGVQATRAVAEAQSALSARQSAREARATELATIKPLVEKGIEPRLSLAQADSAASVAASEAAQAAASLARAQAGVAEANASLAQARQDWRARAADELARAQADLAARASTIPALAARVQRTTVRAPLAGRINRVLVTTVGAAVSPGAPLAEISPSRDTLLIEARIRPEDIARVRTGQHARINITAYDSSIYGWIDGKVESISPDAIVDERAQVSYYNVYVRTDTKGLLDRRTNKLLPIGTGMTAEVNLLGDPRTVLQYILTPITRLSERAFRE